MNRDNWKDVALTCLRDEAAAIEGLASHIDALFEKAVEIILSCRGKLIVTGVGKSGHIGAKIAATMSSTGTPAFFINPLDVCHGDLGVFRKEDVVLAISNSGQTDELLRFMPYLHEQQIPIIGMSGNPDSDLARYSTVHLNTYVEKETGPLGLAPTSSTTAQLAMGDALACTLMSARGFQAKDFAQFHPGGILGRRLLTKAGEVMRSDNLPIVSPDTKMDEALKQIGKGRLGICVAVEDDKVVGLMTDGDSRRAIQRLHDEFLYKRVCELMTKNPICVSANTRVSEIISLLDEHNIHCVLVTDSDNRLLGIIDSNSAKL